MLRIVGWATRYENNRTRELKKTEWVPVPNRMDGYGYLRLVDHPNGAAHLGAWLAILEICSRQEVRGEIPHPTAEIPHRLAVISHLPAGIFVEALPRLQTLGWIELTEIPQEGAGIPQDVAAGCGSRDARAGASIPFPSESIKSFEKKKTHSENGVLSLPLSARQKSWFDESFWPFYWRKVDKAAAFKAYVKHAKSEAVAAQIENAVKSHAEYYLRREPEHQPHASTWLNKLRWQEPSPDEVQRREDYGLSSTMREVLRREGAL